ncbi:hypothetical protein A0H81_12084 [Grifola frondosa]|uniref:Yeast cell wall synthesis Kre9/Knh1-like N-terminal domain-containing protein n=1 Tax=Grifola frondosa TaxID=5627 RepID=A0A1C7LSG6_GRIFR|nr:hypothetical protein A0H81_12084 [Grifola frondosa]
MATSAPIPVTWTKVSTDPGYFDMVLSNQQRNPPTQQVLATHVDGSKGSMAVNPPSGGWVPAPGYQVNFVKDGGILAQSGQFSITKN